MAYTAKQKELAGLAKALDDVGASDKAQQLRQQIKEIAKVETVKQKANKLIKMGFVDEAKQYLERNGIME